MFTGIVRELGVVRRLESSGGLYKLEVSCGEIFKSSGVGDSVSVNGVCLTVTAKTPGALCFDVMAETVRRTSLAGLRSAQQVNLEGALKADGAIDGHFVLGHIDCAGKVAGIVKNNDEFIMEIEFPAEFEDLLVEKGSVTIDGVSLTVGRVSSGTFSVYLIPQTLKSTSLGSKRPGSVVNIEFDIIGKYVKKLNSSGRPGVTESFLKENGF